MNKGCRVWTIKDNYRLGDDIQSKVLAFAFGLSAEIERNLISSRTKEALARKKSEGVVMGRPKGRKSNCENLKLGRYHDKIMKQYAKGVPIAQIARHFHVSRSTIYRYMERLAMEETEEVEPLEWSYRALFQSSTTGNDINVDSGFPGILSPDHSFPKIFLSCILHFDNKSIVV